ncbi:MULTISPECIES: undecaprenyldiphospho-muramoylpentapeptide beta-N-acetylglucosaminyltransferase [unclassified Saccharibacter]|uniref:undecaprenyldiphospho-muramoylpentapeptide beta-N-acetylglucosaminyltransferase n=1 Tax=unclassified Saccharibacter TaxID=2648722 RepID=UPI001320F13A|nr:MULTISPECIES: undecaprenyldiphospho-muramoylpentapeptide beta-N-acetylglucosaminyltransferase [unclassified Saccharibacter]MXV35494.1 undecaprenyldiphospho-muramoylpentapeptide beta-N-acetylglucosaminyltransferase [Saccharibacter sp. EH611]MXV58154.1 undecaprenyldiphospho-muramoylpentapeptide beta-N-acetylglucosaminyltransferase [Saccharibacter sp. EH70]MXV65428.1 undecaprenyldiphospho-muramoylpentapeptide beta-N-acetylglucosaminyltransferase [Saccharibacter sp. EH60]
MNTSIVIAAGGTGGHFFPAEALANHLLNRGYDVVLMTDARNNRVNDGVFGRASHYVLPGGGIAGKGLLGKIKGAFRLLDGTIKARALLSVIRPAAIVGFGGYPSIPPLLGARLLPKASRPQMVIHEGNAILGQANALLARFAPTIATSYPHVARLPQGATVQLTGMPVRDPIEALVDIPYFPPSQDSDDTIQLLVWGGSLGAQIFGRVVPEALTTLPQTLRSRLHVTQQVNEQDLPRIQQQYEEAGINATLAPFIHNVADILQKAHLVIGRAGGSSVAELTMAGRPSILIPLPIAASDEQGQNAQAVERAGAGWMIRQAIFTPTLLADRLMALLQTPERLTQAAAAAKTLQHRKAAERLADLVEATLHS